MRLKGENMVKQAYKLSIISSVSYFIAFLFPFYFGWLALLFVIPIYLSISNSRNFKVAIKAGLIFGFIAFGLHFAWLSKMFFTYSSLIKFFSLGLYLIIISIFSIISSIWFLLCYIFISNKSLDYKFVKITIFTFLTFLFFRFLSLYGLFFLGVKEGYCFFSPLIPLATYRWFLNLYAIFCCVMNLDFNNFSNYKVPKKNIALISEESLSTKINIDFHLPLYYIRSGFNDQESDNISIASQKIYHRLTSLELLNNKSALPVLVISPESTFPFPLNENENLVKLWGHALPIDAYFLLGSYRSANISKNGTAKKKYYQSAFFMQNSKIIDFYDKSHAVPFFEKVPKLWKPYLWADQIFIKDSHPISQGNNINAKKFNIPNSINLIPQLCSELLCDNSIVFKVNEEHKLNSVVVWLVKEIWFMDYFANLMENFAMLTAIKLKMEILYVGYKKVIFFKR